MIRDIPHITVVGDLILDRYLIGDATKMNPEQPGVVIRVDREEYRLGGAAAVAMIATSLGAFVTVAGIVGHDEPGRRVCDLLDAHDIGTHLWRDDRPTTWKQRIVVRSQIRPDRCDREVTTPIPDEAADFLAAVPIGDALLIQDYGKGLCTNRFLAKLVDRSRDAGVPILVDPARSRDWSDYGQVTLIKANWIEATQQRASNDASPFELARRLAGSHHCHVVITLGEQGLVCAERNGETWHMPAVSVPPRDVCGAGDTVLATLGVAIARGETLRDSCALAVRTAAEQVSQVGVVPVPPVATNWLGGCFGTFR
jgi:rfaE bifunctional protein kinase chain/domain